MAANIVYELIAGSIPPGSRVLDVGSGDGTLLSYLQDRKGIQGQGIELQLENFESSLAKGVPVYVGDLYEILPGIADKSFDYVILSHTLQTVTDPLEVLRQMLRIGEHGLVTVPNFGHIVNRFQLMFGGRMPVNKNIPKEWFNTDNIHFCTKKDFEKFCWDHQIPIQSIFSLKNGRRSRTLFPNLFATDMLYLLEGL
jgi:methionine biosynthesis protein MetW